MESTSQQAVGSKTAPVKGWLRMYCRWLFKMHLLELLRVEANVVIVHKLWLHLLKLCISCSMAFLASSNQHL